MTTGSGLRVALVAGTLGQGGAEKQLLYLAGALREMGAAVRVLCLTRGEFFEPALSGLGIEPVWVGRFGNPALRIVDTARALRGFRPHIVQAAHFYVNLYVSAVSPLFGAIGIGTVRSDMVFEMLTNGVWGRWLLRTPSALIVNSRAAQASAVAMGVAPDSVHLLSNVIDLDDFDGRVLTAPGSGVDADEPLVVGVGSFNAAKRFDRFLRVLAAVRSRGVKLRGMLVGDGPDRASLEALAGELGLLPHGVCFTGRRDDVPALLRQADIYLLTSDHEGFPNVLLEAMASRLPVVATAAGDAGAVVENGVTGFVIETGDDDTLAARLAELAGSSVLRRRFGDEGRRRVESCFARSLWPERLVEVYRAIAERQGHRQALALLPR